MFITKTYNTCQSILYEQNLPTIYIVIISVINLFDLINLLVIKAIIHIQKKCDEDCL